MADLVFILFLGANSFAQVMLSPAIKDLETLYPKNKQVLLQCLNKYPSKDKSLGCVDSFKYMKDLCAVVHEQNFERRYNRLQEQILYGACRLSALGDNRLPVFFDLDAKGCVEGFETLNERLVSYNKNRELIENAEEEKFLYMYEKNSCKDYQTYVNFCQYVDGDNKKLLPKDNVMLPKVDLAQKPEELCRPKAAVGEGLYTISHDLSTMMTEQKGKVYDSLILQYRARIPAGVAAFSACEQVRAGYGNLGCAKFEEILDGEPAWRTPDEMRQLRLDRDKVARESNAGNSN